MPAAAPQAAKDKPRSPDDAEQGRPAQPAAGALDDRRPPAGRRATQTIRCRGPCRQTATVLRPELELSLLKRTGSGRAGRKAAARTAHNDRLESAANRLPSVR